MSEAIRREKKQKLIKSYCSRKVQRAKALEESYHAEEEAEKARANREKATREADVIIPAEIERRKHRLMLMLMLKNRIKAKGKQMLYLLRWKLKQEV